jgi:predicted XRE-type DNA-binding protein
VQKVEASSGNVFADLEVPDADEALAKAELAQRICVRGKLDGFSTDRLFRFLNALGQDVEIVVRPRRQGNGRALTRVVSA